MFTYRYYAIMENINFNIYINVRDDGRGYMFNSS